jgi:heavy metal sensor kinase
MGTIGNVFVISIPAVMTLVAVGAWLISASALAPLKTVTATIRRVTVKGLDQRIPIKTVDIEFIEMLQVFNQMMERLERSFKQASRFSADAAHELKTPLAILQGELERNLQQAPLGSPLQQNLSNLLDEVRRLGVIVRKLLLLSLADAGQMRLHKVRTDLSAVLQDLVEDIEVLAPDIVVEVQIPAKLRCAVDLDLLLQVLRNLIDNAIKYNLPPGWIKIHAGFTRNAVTITVSNRSNDIPLEHRQQIFDRFYRGDPARTRRIEGVGIGLSLSREIARAHGGDLTLDHTPSGNTSFTLTLPV